MYGTGRSFGIRRFAFFSSMMRFGWRASISFSFFGGGEEMLYNVFVLRGSPLSICHFDKFFNFVTFLTIGAVSLYKHMHIIQDAHLK